MPACTTRRAFLSSALLASAFGAASLLGPGCAAPTLPLPPPSIAALEAPDAEGFVTVRGSARAGAYMFVLNEDTEEGVIGTAEDTGAFALRIAASTGETLTVWQMVGSQSGQLVSRVVP